MEKKNRQPGGKAGAILQWKGALFLTMWREVEKRYGPGAAKEICRDVMFKAGMLIGERGATEIASRGPRGMEELWELVYPVAQDRILELNDESFVYRNDNCPAFEMLKEAGATTEEIALMADAYCLSDCGFTQGFDPQLVCVHEARLMSGDSYCQWRHYLKK